MGTIASQITSLTIVFSAVYLDTDQRKHKSSASLALVRGIHRRPVNSPQMASNAENVSIWWRHHVRSSYVCQLHCCRGSCPGCLRVSLSVSISRSTLALKSEILPRHLLSTVPHNYLSLSCRTLGPGQQEICHFMHVSSDARPVFQINLDL